MTNARIGCAGFSRRREAYAKRLAFVELSFAERSPKRSTLAQWRQELGGDFAFAVVLPASVWGDRAHPLRDGDAARAAVRAFAEQVSPLAPVAVVARTPQAVSPGSAALQRFVTTLDAFRTVAPRVIWEPHGLWERPAARRLASKHELVVTCDPLHDDVASESVVYARMRGLGADRRYHRGRLEDLAMAIAHATDAFVVFDTEDAWREACKLKAIADGDDALDAMTEGPIDGDETDDDEDDDLGDDDEDEDDLDGDGDDEDDDEDDLDDDGDDGDDDEDDGD